MGVKHFVPRLQKSNIKRAQGVGGVTGGRCVGSFYRKIIRG